MGSNGAAQAATILSDPPPVLQYSELRSRSTQQNGQTAETGALANLEPAPLPYINRRARQQAARIARATARPDGGSTTGSTRLGMIAGAAFLIAACAFVVTQGVAIPVAAAGSTCSPCSMILSPEADG